MEKPEPSLEKSEKLVHRGLLEYFFSSVKTVKYDYITRVEKYIDIYF